MMTIQFLGDNTGIRYNVYWCRLNHHCYVVALPSAVDRTDKTKPGLLVYRS